MAQTTGEATIDIDASPDAVWAILTDLSRIGDLSPECVKAEWEGDSTGPTIGATFHGFNEAGGNQWDVPGCEVVAADPGREWAFTVPSQDGPKQTWRYVIEETAAGSRVTESFDSPILSTDFFTQMDPPRHEQLLANIAQTLDRLKKVAEG